MKSFALSLTVALLSVVGSCVYTNVHAPLAYRSATPADVTGPLGADADGEACSQLVLWLVAWGDGGYSAAVEDAKRKSNASLLVDVQADRRIYNVLGVYQKACTRVRGRTVR